MKKHIKTILELFFVFIFLLQTSGLLFIAFLYANIDANKTYAINKNKTSQILSNEGEVILEVDLTKENGISFKEIPDVFINALISGEDARFFSHSGIDAQRIISSLINNIKSTSFQGASTLTQQLVKNTILDSSKTLKRKISEVIIALKLENELTKEDILEAYCNNIMFDGITLGANNASYRFFNKHLSNITLPEAALLAGIVNAPTYFNPIKNPDNAKKRMDTILTLMHRHGYINENELEIAKKVQVQDLIKPASQKEKSYAYQSYIDIVYKQTMDILNESYYTKPLIIETALNTKAQEIIDDIQNGKIFYFSDNNQEFALALIDNQTGALIASMGGRNYNGELLFNRTYDMKNQPASTIKPLLSYALGIEALNYNSKEVLIDAPYTYLDGTSVNNVDFTYKGELLIEDAIGYSRNTTALETLNNVINVKGINYVTNYLNSINLLDVNKEEFVEAYALGAFKYGVSPYNLASAYSMIANKGYYLAPYTIKRILDSTTGEVLYTHTSSKKKVLESSSADILTEILKKVVDNNYYGLGSLKINNIPLYLKSGTSSFDTNTLKKYNYPANASKDLWIAGFSKQYSFAIWTGFDAPVLGEKNYFNAGSDSRKNYHKDILKYVLQNITSIYGEIEPSDEITKVNIVKGTNLLPDEYTPNYLITEAIFKKGLEPKEKIHPSPLKDITDLDLLIYDDKINVIFNDYITIDLEKENTIYSQNKVYGDIEYVIEINGVQYISDSPDFYIEINNNLIYNITAYTRYSKVNTITSKLYYDNFLLI